MSFYCLNIFLGMFLPEDTSTITLRKKIMCFSGLIGLFAVGFRLPVAILAITDQGTTWASMFVLFAALARATGIIHFALARYHRTASNPQMLWVCITVGLAITLTCFADPASSFGAYHAVVGLVVMWLVDIQPRTPFVLWSVAMNLVVWWNQSVLAMQDPELHPWLLAAPGAQLGGSGSVALHLLDWAIGWGGVSVLIVGLVHIETREYKHNLKGSKFANEVVESMLEQLTTFDVQAAQQTLRDAESVVDEETKKPMLAAQFSDLLESLCDQLESYRPFLPNWVLMTQDDGPEVNPLSGEVSEQQQISMHVKFGGAGSSAAELSDISSNDFEGSAPEELQSVKNFSAPEEFQSVSNPVKISPKTRPVKGNWAVSNTSEDSLSTSWTHHQKMSPRHRNVSPESPGVRSLGRSLNTGPVLKPLRTITVSLLDFAPQLGAITKEAVYMQVLQGVLDAVARSAKTTHASIHGTTGDQIVAAWNASHNVAQPELKACQFLCQVKAQVAERNFANVHLSAGAKTGKAWCHHVVSNTGSKTSSFAIHYPWRSALHALCRHAKSFRTILVDEQTFELGQLQCEGWLVDALAPAKAETPAGDRVEVFESVLNAGPPTTSTSAILQASTSNHAPASFNLCQTSISGGLSISKMQSTTSNVSFKSPSNLNLQLPKKSKVVLCYELLNEKPVANDEWLYALQASEGSPYESMTTLAKKWMTSRNSCNNSQRGRPEGTVEPTQVLGGPGGLTRPEATKSRVAFSPEMDLRYAAPNENQPGLSVSALPGGDLMILQPPPQIPPGLGEPQPLPEISSSSLTQESATLFPVLLGNSSTATATLTDENTQKKVQSPEAAHVLRSMEEGKVPSTLLARRLLSKSNE